MEIVFLSSARTLLIGLTVGLIVSRVVEHYARRRDRSKAADLQKTLDARSADLQDCRHTCEQLRAQLGDAVSRGDDLARELDLVRESRANDLAAEAASYARAFRDPVKPGYKPCRDPVMLVHWHGLLDHVEPFAGAPAIARLRTLVDQAAKPEPEDHPEKILAALDELVALLRSLR